MARSIDQMQKAISEWPVKTYIGLYQTLDKFNKCLRIPASELRAFEMNLPIYLESYFSDAFGDTGTLQGMQDLESRSLVIMAAICIPTVSCETWLRLLITHGFFIQARSGCRSFLSAI